MTKTNKNIKYIAGIIVVALLYTALAKIGLLFALPPGYATFFWPASGLALAAVYVCGWPYAIGVFIGAFLGNIIPLDNNFINVISIISFVNAFSIAIGSTLQCCVAALLLKKYIGPRTRLLTFREIAKFGAIAGPLVCLISSTWGAATLSLTSSIDISNILFIWGTWYAGDMLGILIFAPLLILLFSKEKTSTRRKWQVTVPLLFIFTLVITSFVTMRMIDENEKQRNFDLQTELLHTEISDSIKDTIFKLNAVQSLFYSSQEVSENEFQLYTNHLAEKMISAGSITYAKIIFSATELDQNMTLKSFTADKNIEASAHECVPFCTVITMRYPSDVKDKVYGLDLMSQPDRRQAILNSLVAGAANFTAPINLATKKNQKGFLIFIPVVNDQKYQFTAPLSLDYVRGFIVSALVFEDLLNSKIRQIMSLSKIHFNIYDMNNGDKVRLYSSETGSGAARNFNKTHFLQIRNYNAGQRQWQFEFYITNQDMIAQTTWTIWYALAASLVFTFISAAFLFTITGQTARIEDIVHDKTSELSYKNNFQTLMMNNIPDLIFVKDRHSNIVQANTTFLSIYNPEERDRVIGAPAFEHFSEEDAKMFRQKDLEAFEKGFSINEEKVTHYGGDTRDYTVRKISFKTDSGEEYLLALGRDITTEKKALENLRASEKRFRASLEHAPIGMALLDMQRNFIEYNDVMAEMVGYSFDDFRNARLKDITHPDDLNKDTQQLQDLLEGNIQNYSIEKRYIHTNGSIIYVYLSLALIRNDKNEPEYYIAQSLDITEQKEAEETRQQLGKIQEASLAEMYIIDADNFHILEFNSGAMRNLGYTKAQMKKLKAYDFVQGTDAQSLKKTFTPLLSGEKTNLEFETVQMRKDGSTYNSITNLQKIDYKGAPAIMALVIDNTERKTMELELQRSNQELQDFAYIASHDLKAPLRHIMLSAQFLKEQYAASLDGRALEFMNIMVAGSERMQAMVKGLLDYARVRENAMEEFTPIHINDAINDALANLTQLIKENNASVFVDDMPENLKANKTLITQLFQNLIQNSIKYRQENVAPQIVISADIKGREWTISVTDNSIGIAPEHAEKIFKVFQRLHGEGKYEGTGIGLSICQRIVQFHNGEIWLDTDYKDGCRFMIRLPNA